MRASTWVVIAVVMVFIGLLVAYAMTPPGDSGAAAPAAAPRSR